MYLRATTTYGSLIPGSEYIRDLVRRGTISPEAAKKLRWMDHWNRHRNARLTCRYFGISPKTFYRWWNRFDPYDLTTLEEVSRRPRHVRQPQTPAAVVEAILELRNQYPRWGKKKLVVLLARKGIRVSASTVGRVMNRLKARGVLVEPVNVTQAKLARRRRRKPRYAVRKPKDYRALEPGDLVEVDTLQIKFVPGEIRYQFSARDVVCRYDVIRAYTRQTSLKAAHFLHYLRKKFPYPVRAIQIDGGSEFKDQFEEECKAKKIPLFVLPPKSPKLNGHVERSNRTHREEFYEVYDIDLNLEEHNKQLAKWEHVYNYIRPHESLDYLTPYQYYRQWKRDSRQKALPM
jgi:transposase InsO family protein